VATRAIPDLRATVATRAIPDRRLLASRS
jgi:hypothetical protein